jgi:putative endopeptidase
MNIEKQKSRKKYYNKLKKNTITKRHNKRKTRRQKFIHTKRKTKKTQTRIIPKQLLTQINPNDLSVAQYEPFEKEYSKQNEKYIKKGYVEKHLIQMFNKSFKSKHVLPNNDFYTYINYLWLETTKKETDRQTNSNYYVQIDNFRVTQDLVYNQLLDIISNYIKTGDKTSKHYKCFHNVYKSFEHLSTSDILKHCKITYQHHMDFFNTDKLWEYISHINSNEIVSWGCPIVWKIQSDEKHSNRYVNYIYPIQLTLYDVTIYFGTDSNDSREDKIYKAELKQKYIEYIDDIFKNCLPKGVSGIGYTGKDVFDVEVEIAQAFSCSDPKLEKLDTPDYNIVTKEEALHIYGFDWVTFSKSLGYVEPPDYFICQNVSYLKCMCKMLKDNWRSDKWRGYWLFIYYRQMIRFDVKLHDIHYQFISKYIHGAPAKFPLKLITLFGISLTFNTFLTNAYVKKYKNQQVVDYTLKLGEDLIEVFKRIIRRNTWLTPKTRKYALQKLQHLRLDVVEPVNLREDPLLDYSNTDAWENMIIITGWRMKNMVSLNGDKVTDIPVVDWSGYQFKLIGQQAYIVNAMYTPTLNSIYIPLGYLQKPFVDLDERGIEYNLANIGNTLAHEMSHALDDVGSLYDYKGNLHNWWTDSDKKTFVRKQNNIIKQYAKFALYDGLKYDATSSIGEDLADISGIAICQEYLKDFQDKNNDIVPIRSISFKSFYIYFAVQERQHIYKNAIIAQLKTNPHPPDKYRTNIPLSRLKLFRSLYNVKPKDKMYWENTDTIW